MNGFDKEILRRQKVSHKEDMEKYSAEVREYVDEYGPKPCDYLLNRQIMSNYHRGAYNALNELEKELKK